MTYTNAGNGRLKAIEINTKYSRSTARVEPARRNSKRVTLRTHRNGGTR